jgi:hypothetical protein
VVLPNDGSGISIDCSGNIYVTGSFSGNVNFGGTILSSQQDASDVFVVKIDNDGNWIWAIQSVGEEFVQNQGNSIFTDCEGNSYVTGLFSETVNFGTNVLNSSTFDAFITKIDTTGTWLWAVAVQATGTSFGFGISVDCSGNSLVTGSFSGSADFGPYTLNSAGGTDIFVTKIDSTGTWLWAISAGGTDSDSGRAITVDSKGNSYVTGEFRGSANFGPAIVLTTIGTFDAFVAKVNPNGAWLWATQAGGTSASGRGIDVDSKGNSYVTGVFSGSATFGPFVLTSINLFDIFTATVNANGSWTRAIAVNDTGIGTTSSTGIAVDIKNNIYITGTFSGTLTFDTISLTATSGLDGYVAKYETAECAIVGILKEDATTNDIVTVYFPDGVISDTFTNLDPGQYYYIDCTCRFSTNYKNAKRFVGVALSDSSLLSNVKPCLNNC